MTLRWVGLKGRILRDSLEIYRFAGISPEKGQQAVPTPSCWPFFGRTYYCIMPIYDLERHRTYLTPTEGDLLGIYGGDLESRRFQCDELPGLLADVIRATNWAQTRSYASDSEEFARAKTERERLESMGSALCAIVEINKSQHGR
jgi:hypothetical protein